MTRERRALPPQPYVFFKSLWNAFYPSKQLILMLAQKDGKTIAGLMLLLFKDRVTAEFAASDKKYKDLSPNHYLFWQAIRMAHEKGFRVFDFGRTSPLNASLMDFKKRWGTREVDLAQFYFPAGMAAGASNKEQSQKYRIIRRVFSLGLPEYAQSLLGGFVYRHLG
jgi:lipid II:glycine glycyltransferase (peptidoglycan interpeptide bridge formation enzyme)